MPSVNTVGNHQSETHFNATRKLTVLWIHSNMLSSLTRLSQILTILAATGVRSVRYIPLMLAQTAVLIFNRHFSR